MPPKIVFLLCCLSVAAAGTRLSARSVPDDAPRVEHAEQPVPCIVCRKPMTGEHLRLHRRGRTVDFCIGSCADAWDAEPERYFRILQANGALFDEESVQADIVSAWLLLGLYMAAGLVCGAGCAYLATAKGHAVREWFILGLIFNVPALLTAAFMSKRDVSALPQGVPGGLRKVPTTRAPARCSGCGAPLHPSARSCPACGAAHRPTAEAETARL